MGIDKYRKFIELFSSSLANFCPHSYSGGRFPTRGNSQRRARNNYNSRGIAHLAQALAHAMSSKWGAGGEGVSKVPKVSKVRALRKLSLCIYIANTFSSRIYIIYEYFINVCISVTCNKQETPRDTSERST